MASKRIFGGANSIVPVPTTTNEAGGKAFAFSDEHVLAQYVVTSCLNDSFYIKGEAQADTIIALANKCRPEFVAKCAVYAAEQAKMKDTPALLMAVLSTRGETGLNLLKQIFNRVVKNTKMLRNYVQIIRSGKVGRKSFGHGPKKLIQQWLRNQNATSLFKGSVGNDPSLADVVKLVRPKPENNEKQSFYAWLLGKEYSFNNLPSLLQHFESYKRGDVSQVPPVPFRMLTALPLNTPQWTEIALNANWDTVRQNLNTFQRHGVLDNTKAVNQLAQLLSDVEQVRRNNVFPYQLFTTFKATEGKIPTKLSLALQDAVEHAINNVPSFDTKIAVCVDVSGSMNNPVTGYREGSTTVTRCVDVAALIAASILRTNQADTLIVPFDTGVRNVELNPRDSIVTNAKKLAMNGGGTACHEALAHLNRPNWRNKAFDGDLVIFVSDNESWYGQGGYRSTGVAEEWQKYKRRNKKAKLICIDLQANASTQILDNGSVLNIGGFSDEIWPVIKQFVEQGNTNFVKTIENVEI